MAVMPLFRARKAGAPPASPAKKATGFAAAAANAMTKAAANPYEAERNARIAANLAKMKQFKLFDAKQKLEKVCAKPKRTKAPLKRKRSAQADPDAEARRSRRQRKQVAEVDPSKMSQLDLQLAGLEPRNKRRVRYVDPDAETDVDTDEDSEDEVRVRRRRKEWTFELASLPEETLAKLHKVDLLEGMRAFLETDKWHCEWFDRPASETNVSRVMRQLERLASGEGVQHPRSRRKGSCFMEGEALTLAHDMEQLYQEAWNFTDVHGRDLGNGWLLHHPIKKCYAFQQHLYTNGLVDYAVKKWGV